jgi:hypothetical protein
MHILAAYNGRTIDVLAWRGGGVGGEYKIEQSLADANSTGAICTGLQKLAQRFLITFLNEKGSLKYSPKVGTNFMTKLRQGRIHNEIDMSAAFSLAEMDVRRQMITEESNTDPEDEKYLRAELTGMQVIAGYANLTIALRSRSKSAQFILPIKIVV